MLVVSSQTEIKEWLIDYKYYIPRVVICFNRILNIYVLFFFLLCIVIFSKIRFYQLHFHFLNIQDSFLDLFSFNWTQISKWSLLISFGLDISHKSLLPKLFSKLFISHQCGTNINFLDRCIFEYIFYHRYWTNESRNIFGREKLSLVNIQINLP